MSLPDGRDEILSAAPVEPLQGEPATADFSPDETLTDGASPVLRQLRYVLSLPERGVRTGAGVMAGAAREAATLLIPRSFQSSQTYTVMVRQMLDFLAEDVGGVARRPTDPGAEKLDNFVARKAVGNFMEMAALATLHVSPLTLLAVVSDLAYGSQTYLQELAVELKRQGVIDEHSSVNHVNDLLAAVADASRTTAQAFNAPPLSVDGLKDTIDQTRRALAEIRPADILPQAELQRMWEEMRETARDQGVDLLSLSGAMTLGALDKIGSVGRGAMSSVKVAGSLLDRHVVDHYRSSLVRIQTEGIYRSLAETSGPYVAAVWENFSASKSTVTEDLLSGKLIGQAWGGMRRWLGNPASPLP